MEKENIKKELLDKSLNLLIFKGQLEPAKETAIRKVRDKPGENQEAMERRCFEKECSIVLKAPEKSSSLRIENCQALSL